MRTIFLSRISFLALFFSTTFSLNGQIQKSSPINTFVLNVTFEDEIYTDKCDCCSRGEYNEGRCELYRIKVQDVILMRDSTLYDSFAIKKIKYAVVSDRNFIPNKDDVYSIGCQSSCVEEYLIVNELSKELSSKSGQIYNTDLPANFSGLSRCLDLSGFQKFLISINLFKQIIYRNAKKENIEDCIFLKRIKNYERKTSSE